jgi:hypothetical protein
MDWYRKKFPSKPLSLSHIKSQFQTFATSSSKLFYHFRLDIFVDESLIGKYFSQNIFQEIRNSPRTIELIIIIENSSTGAFLFANHREIIWCQARGSLRFYQQIISNVDNNIHSRLISAAENSAFVIMLPLAFWMSENLWKQKSISIIMKLKRKFWFRVVFHPNNRMMYTKSSLNFTGMLHALTVLPLRLLSNRNFPLSYESQ